MRKVIGMNSGVFRATVVDIGDPEQRGRIRISRAAGEAVWAEVLVTGAPPLATGATVIVANEGGDPMRPIVLGALA